MQLNTNYQLLGKVTIPSSVATTEVRLYAKIGTQNIASNYTPVTSKITFYRGAGNYQASSWSTNLTGDVSGSNSGKANFGTGETTLLERTQNIYHNQDGSKGINIGAYYNDSYQGKNKTIGNVYVTLPTIPRASKLGNIPDFTVDGNEGVGIPFSVPYTKYYDGFKQYLGISYVDNEGSLYPNFVERDNFEGTQVTLTSEELEQFYTLCSTGNTMKVRVFLNTYTGDSYIGTNYKSIGSDDKFVNASISTTGLLPTLDLSSITYEDINTDTKVVTGNNQLIIQNASRLQTSISEYAVAHKGATISSYRIETTTKAGIERKDFASNSPLPMKYNFNKPTTNQFVVKVFDSRGNQTTHTITYDLINWVEPVISKFDVTRTNGVEEATYIEASGTYSTLGSLGNNIEEAYYRYREVGSTTWSSEQQLTLPSSSEGKWTLAKVYVADFDVSKEYEFELYIRDRIGTNKSTDTLNSAEPYMWHKRKSKLLGIGKKPKDGLPEGSVDIAGGYYVNGSKLNSMSLKVNDNMTNAKWNKICNIKIDKHIQGEFCALRIFIGDGQNSRPTQNAYIDLVMQLGWVGENSGRLGCTAELHKMRTSFSPNSVFVKVIANNYLDYDVWIKTLATYCKPNYVPFVKDGIVVTQKSESSTDEPAGTECLIDLYSTDVPEDVLNKIVVPSGFTLQSKYSTLYRINKRYFGDVIVQKDSGTFVPTQDLVFGIKGVSIKKTAMGGCFLCKDLWSVESVGYLYFGFNGANQRTDVIVADKKSTGCNIVKIHVDFLADEV